MKAYLEPREWTLAHDRSLMLGASSRIMGILNVTTDSFSDGGDFIDPDVALSRANEMIDAGAAIIDVGGESTRPGSEPVTAEIEQERVLSVIEALSRQTDVLISVDTYRAETARIAIEAGAHIINDVWGCQKEPAIAEVAASTGAGLCIMHTGRGRDLLPDVVDDQKFFLSKSLEIAKAANVSMSQIVLDPGFGFAKETSDENLHLLNRFEELHSFKLPLMIGTSRKRFLGTLTGREPTERDIATCATSVVARQKGASVFRVHDVASNLDALKITDALMHAAAKKED